MSRECLYRGENKQLYLIKRLLTMQLTSHRKASITVPFAFALLSVARAGFAATLVDTGQTQCCSSIVPEMPPATYYGATMQRSDDPLLSNELTTKSPVEPTDAPGPALSALEQILDDREGKHGAMSAELIEPLADLANAYVREGRLREAQKTLRRGIHVARINEGLHSPGQINMLRQLIDIYVEREDFPAADAQQAYLYRVLKYRREHNLPGMREATLQYADWIRGAYLGDLGRQRFPRLVGLNDLYEEAIEEIEDSEGANSRKLLPYLKGRAELSYLISVYPGEHESGFRGGVSASDTIATSSEAQLRFWRMRDFNFRYGLKALERRQEILRSDPSSSAQERAESLIAIADWYQWHRRYASAIKLYEEAWSSAQSSAEANSWLETSFAQPLELPRHTAFTPGAVPLGTLNDAEIAIRFDVSRHGEAKNIRILSEETQETQAGVTRAYHYLRNMRFRPRLAEGSVVRAENVERNYQIRY